MVAYRVIRKDGSQKDYPNQPCFSGFNYSVEDSILRNVSKIKLIQESEVKSKTFINLLKSAYPEGMIDAEGAVSADYPADYVMSALSCLRQPSENRYSHLLEEMYPLILKAHKEVTRKHRQIIKLSTPLLVALMCIPGAAITEGKVTLESSIIYTHVGHSSMPWDLFEWADLWYLSRIKAFEGGVQETLAKQQGYRAGYSGLPLRVKPKIGTYVTYNMYDPRTKKNSVAGALVTKFDLFQKNWHGDYVTTYNVRVNLYDVFVFIFEQMIQNKTRK